ncbi:MULTISPECIES: hypothetical protein [Aliivibrio]|uniref:Uncharacterized protein n=1 Tax=Aliivibrio sifiae TaxID=566293 RepID=A0A2S7X8K9_9GAMM|nr:MULTISPECIES: hypothetical protein [Aliivibrio]MCE7556422.1 hypothetical protein [Aliivibrio fischeri]MCE7563013.1 hypothetical protein [Aliivibrio fischeri]MCE7571305.1 hypothetical protein [Aliivibrio fischeri]MUK39612.1 hypothetical protein [Aliivibrio fischeri]MUL08184.1 hypothetical protein [Aliivibrio fischeri]
MEKIVQLEFSDEDLDKFERISGIKWKIKGAYSRLFLADLMAFYELHFIGSDEIFMTLNDYEKGKNFAGTKPPTIFRKSPLKGLHHIHFYSPRYIKNNVDIALGKNGLKNIISDVLDTNESMSIDEQAKLISKRAVTDTLNDRRIKGKMTGEWVIFTKYEGKNYYLCLARHNDDDHVIRERIEKHCLLMFPFLKDILVPL